MDSLCCREVVNRFDPPVESLLCRLDSKSIRSPQHKWRRSERRRKADRRKGGAPEVSTKKHRHLIWSTTMATRSLRGVANEAELHGVTHGPQSRLKFFSLDLFVKTHRAVDRTTAATLRRLRSPACTDSRRCDVKRQLENPHGREADQLPYRTLPRLNKSLR